MTEPEHISFPSIGQFANFKKELKYYVEHNKVPDEITLTGTVKLHGTHADIIFDEKTKAITFQSRNRVLTIDSDNMGFVEFMTQCDLACLFNGIKWIFMRPVETIMVSGEFCGGNIQKGVALTKLPRMFCIFDIKINNEWRHLIPYSDLILPEHIYRITRAPMFKLKMDPRTPDLIIPRLIELTNQVENECPFAKTFGVSGTGEGIVWKCSLSESSRFWFKTKGEKHSVSKVTTLKPKTPKDLEALTNIKHFSESAATEARLKQGLDYLCEMKLDLVPDNMGTFLSWVTNDVLKEEADAIKEMNVDVKALKKELSCRARGWFLLNAL